MLPFRRKRLVDIKATNFSEATHMNMHYASFNER